jgi:hypothetical protein
MKILLWDFNAKVGREDIFKSTVGKESLYDINNDTGIRVVNFATSKNLIVKSTMFPHRNIHKFTWTPPDGKTHNQINYILTDRRRHSSILDVRSIGQRIVTLTTTWWLQKLGKDWQLVNKQRTEII